MLRLSTSCRNPGKMAGGPIDQLRPSMKTMIQPSISTVDVDQRALRLKMQSYLAQEMISRDGSETDYIPPLRRKWVKAPKSMLSTSQTQRDWFRVMSFNMMVDQYNNASKHHTTPVGDVQVRVPSFTRYTTQSHTFDGVTGDRVDHFVDYDHRTDTELPPFLTLNFRRDHLIHTIKHYDPDLVCLNEVNRTFFFGDLWKYVRFLGYGTLYQSSRGARVSVLRKGEDPNAARNVGKIPEDEDIGNVVLFHKGRFTPLLMPGRDLPGNFHFGHFVSFRDKVTNLNLNVGCVQLTAGDTQEASAIRLHEAQQALVILKAMASRNTDCAHTTTILCGDLNNSDDEEPCVEAIRGHFFSTYDALGGPRWTAWYYRKAFEEGGSISSGSSCPISECGYSKYYAKNVKEMRRTDWKCVAEEEIQRHMRPHSRQRNEGKPSQVKLLTEKSIATLSRETSKPAMLLEGSEAGSSTEEKLSSGVFDSTSGPERADMLALSRAPTRDHSIIHRTQDFIFYEPHTLSLHQALDIPEDEEIDLQQLLPCSKLPSHHLPLMVDVSFNNTNPEV